MNHLVAAINSALKWKNVLQACIKGPYVAAKNELKVVGKRLNFLRALVDE